MPDSIAVLRQLGVEIPDDVGYPFRGIRFLDAYSAVSADFPTGVARGVRRTALHKLLVQHAVALGIVLVWNAKHVRLTAGGVSLTGRFIEAQFVVGADGQNSRIRCQAGLERVTRERRRYGFRRHYRVAPWSSYMELHWGRDLQLYVTPIASDEVCVASLSRNPQIRLEEALSAIPDVKERLTNAEPVSPEMGAISISRTLKAVQSENVFLTGDASGSVDAITGEGMCLAFKEAVALSNTLGSGDARAYQLCHRALMKRPQAMASLILTLDRSAHLRRRTLAGLAQHPEIFESLVAVHVGAAHFRHLWSRRLLNFGRSMLAA
jgi:flavin-dependent dehydrogenase